MSDWFLGEIRLFPMGWAPDGWHLCDGTTMQIQQNPALYSLLGTTYGGNGTTTFNLPDLRGRAMVHQNQTDPSGNYLRGDHIYNPHTGRYGSDDIVSLTVIGADVMEADRYATAAFAMGRNGIHFIERVPGLEGYEIDKNGVARMTSGLGKYLPC